MTQRVSEKSTSIDRDENITRGNLSAKKVALYTYDADTDTLIPQGGGFSPNATITTTIDGDVIIQTDGTKTYTVTIDGNTITEEWS
jgi:hypothetical protein